jgi:hypothetical protein
LGNLRFFNSSLHNVVFDALDSRRPTGRKRQWFNTP